MTFNTKNIKNIEWAEGYNPPRHVVRILKFPIGHVNDYAWVDYIDPEDGTVTVSNDESPSGTLSYESFAFDEVDGDIIRVIKAMKEFVTEMENYSYYGSNPGIPECNLDEVAERILEVLGKRDV